MKLIGDTAGDDSDDAGMPIVPGKHDAAPVALVHTELQNLRLSFGGEFLLGLLTLSVLTFEVGGDFLGADGTTAGEQLDCQTRMAHAAGGIESRRQAKADVVAL